MTGTVHEYITDDAPDESLFVTRLAYEGLLETAREQLTGDGVVFEPSPPRWNGEGWIFSFAYAEDPEVIGYWTPAGGTVEILWRRS